MTGVPGVDSEYAPTVTQAATAAGMGVKWWGYYCGGADAARVWSPGETAVLRQVGVAPLGVWVPRQTFDTDPLAEADQAVAAAVQRGQLSGGLVADAEHDCNTANLPGWWRGFQARVATHLGFTAVLYDGPHTRLAGCRWEPRPGSWQPGDALGAGYAVQYASDSIAGLSVDRDMADPTFPLGAWTTQQPGPPPAPIPVEGWDMAGQWITVRSQQLNESGNGWSLVPADPNKVIAVRVLGHDRGQGTALPRENGVSADPQGTSIDWTGGAPFATFDFQVFVVT